MKVRCLLPALVLVAGCGSTEKRASETPNSASAVPTCDQRARAALPEGFPASFPLPQGTVVTLAGTSPGGGVFIRALTPLELEAAARFFQKRVPAAGFTAGKGDHEFGEAEQEFSGKGVEGKWKVNSIPRCAGKVSLIVAVAPKGS